MAAKGQSWVRFPYAKKGREGESLVYAHFWVSTTSLAGLFIWAVETPLRQIVLLSNESIAMSTDSMHRYSQCKRFKSSDEYGMRQRG